MSAQVPGPGAPVLVGMDGSEGSTAALGWAVAVAGATGAEVIAVHAAGLLAHLGDRTVPAQAHRADLLAALEGWVATGPAQPAAAVRCRLVEGNPILGLLAAAAEEHAALIVVGRRGAGGYPGLELGSTSRALAERAGVPVVIIPGSTTGPEAGTGR